MVEKKSKKPKKKEKKHKEKEREKEKKKQKEKKAEDLTSGCPPPRHLPLPPPLLHPRRSSV